MKRAHMQVIRAALGNAAHTPNREEWALEHVTKPRPAWTDTHEGRVIEVRQIIEALMPEEECDWTAGLRVRRVRGKHHSVFVVGDQRIIGADAAAREILRQEQL